MAETYEEMMARIDAETKEAVFQEKMASRKRRREEYRAKQALKKKQKEEAGYKSGLVNLHEEGH